MTMSFYNSSAPPSSGAMNKIMSNKFYSRKTNTIVFLMLILNEGDSAYHLKQLIEGAFTVVLFFQNSLLAVFRDYSRHTRNGVTACSCGKPCRYWSRLC